MAQEEGDKVKSGDVIAEIETDKATMEVEAVDEGTLGKILVPEGTDDVKVNTPIAMISRKARTLRALKSRRPADAAKAKRLAAEALPSRSRAAKAPRSRAEAEPNRPRPRRRRSRSCRPSRTCRKAPRWSP